MVLWPPLLLTLSVLAHQFCSRSALTTPESTPAHLSRALLPFPRVPSPSAGGALSPQTPRTMGEPRYLQADCAFGPGAHTVRVTLARATLRVEVEAHGTADLWRGEFDATCECRRELVGE